ncbi:MAG: hypothetical protein NZ551_12360 [Microscillaceae bacterium]|nr:hypothetical protein [Microscillaceae bacterium]MDW8461986.1 hypothetical protein [Cytophagales bacterium]
MRKKIVRLFLWLLPCLLCTSFANAQVSKAEQKKLKAELKAFSKNPESFKKFKEELRNAKIESENLEKELIEKQNIQDQNAQKLKELDDEIGKLMFEKRRLEKEQKETENAIKTTKNEEGVGFKVQLEIGDADLYKELTENGEKKPIFSGDIGADGVKRYTLGYFKTRKEAEEFKKYLNILHIKDAKVIEYK